MKAAPRSIVEAHVARVAIAAPVPALSTDEPAELLLMMKAKRSVS
jgi:hypothetical protein